MKGIWALVLLGASPLAAQQFQLRLLTGEDNPPGVMAALDVVSTLDKSKQGVNPFVYDCVAFVELKSSGTDSIAAFLSDEAAVWVAPATDRLKRRRPRIVSLRSAGHVLLVSLDPGDSRLEYVVGIDTAAVRDGADTITVQDLVTEPFGIPHEELIQCGRVPTVDIDLLAPDGEQAGFNAVFDVLWRRPLRIAGGGLFELGFHGAGTSSAQSTLLNALSVNSRLDVKLSRGYKHWVSIGVIEGLEATERFDVVDFALGVSTRVKLDFKALDALRGVVRRFTPYPMVTFEYNLVDRLKGSGEPAMVGRPDTEHRLRGQFDWTVPMIMGTTLRAHLQADYLMSDVPAGQSRLRTVNDLTFEYPLGMVEDMAFVVQWLEGRAAPAYELVSHWLLGVGLRR